MTVVIGVHGKQVTFDHIRVLCVKCPQKSPKKTLGRKEYKGN